MLQIMHYRNFYMQVLVACFSSLVLTFFKHFVCLFFLIIFWSFFIVNSGVFLHNRVATLSVSRTEKPLVMMMFM